jgi:hypothetical protein
MSARVDDVRRAYAVFGLRAGAPEGQVRRRYKALARRWHPDRHAREAGNQAEAASRMREINAAYHCLVGHLARHGPRSVPIGASLAAFQGGTSPSSGLSREELDSLVEAIGSDGPIDWLLDILSRIGGALRRALLAFVVMSCILRIAFQVSRGGAAAVFRDPTLFLVSALLALLLLREWTAHRKVLGR